MHKGIIVCLLSIMLPASAGAAQGKSEAKPIARDTLFIDASIDNRTPYVGQETLLTYNLFFKTVAPRISDTGKAEHPGLWAQEVTPERYIRSTPTVVSGQEYRKAVVKQLRLIPIQAGRLAVSNYRLRCFLPQDGGPGFENARDIETVITAPTTVIDAKPLPKPVPEGFSGAVGDFTISLATDRYQVHTGEPVNLSVKISGRGNLQTFPPVALELPAEFRQEAPSAPTIIQEGTGKTGEAVASKFSLIPSKPGTYRFTPVRMTAFNPWTSRYMSLTSGEITVTVLPGTAAPKPAAPEPLPAPEPQTAKWIPQAVMIAMAAGVVLVIAALYRAGTRQRKQRSTPAGKSDGQPQPIPAAMESADTLRRRLFESLRGVGIPNPAGMTSLQLKKALMVRNVKSESAEALLELLKMIDHAVYTPGQTSKESLEKLNRRTHEVIRSLSKRATP